MVKLFCTLVLIASYACPVVAAAQQQEMPTANNTNTAQSSPATAPAASTQPDAGAPVEIGWPRTFNRIGRFVGESEFAWPRVVVYQPQVDSWEHFRRATFRSAVVVHLSEQAEPVFGVIEAQARTIVDDFARLVALTEIEQTYRFPNVDPETAAQCQALLAEVIPQRSSMDISLDRMLASIDSPEVRQHEVEVSLDPPPIFYCNREAILINFLGAPKFKPIEGTSLQFAVNCNWDVIVDPSIATTYLLYGQSWLKTRDLHRGPWEPARQLPDSFNALPANEQWGDVREQIPGSPLDIMPQVFMSRVPSEIIVTDGDPQYTSIPGIRLRAVTNTDAPLFRHTGDMNFYYLVAGRWFRAKTLEGPWSAATRDLPPDFKQIPRDSDWAYVLASVPGTDEAADAVMLASVPRRAKVQVDEVKLSVAYLDGPPKFAPIEGTTIEGATNTSSAVFRCDGAYYCCENAVWFKADDAKGPWAVATSVPNAIYGIPPSYPAYNVTYAKIIESADAMVETEYTSGYDNALVTAGVLVLGAGVIAAVIAADDVNWNVRINMGGNTISSYGSGAFYSSAAGFYCRSGNSYGPYAGAGGGARYNAASGGWNRRPPSGGSGWSGSVSVNSAGGFGAPLGGGNRYSSWNRGVQSTGGERLASARGPSTADRNGWTASGERGGSSRTANRRGGDGDLYADRDGNVFKRDSAGNWQQRDASGWKGAGDRASSMERQAMARGRGIAASDRASGGRSGFSGGGRNRGGGGGRRGR